MVIKTIWSLVLSFLVLLISSQYAFCGAFAKGGVSGIGARPMGMGGAFVSIADSGDAIFYNPAGLVQVLRPEISGMGSVLLNGEEDLFDIAYVQPFGDQMAWAIATQQLLTTDPSASENERIYYATFATPLAVDKSISFGINVKLFEVDSSIPNQQANGLGLDMGFLYHIPILDPRYGKQINLGLEAEDLDTTIHWEQGNDQQIPLRVRGGLSYEFTDDLVAACEFSDFNDPDLGVQNTILLAGIEGWFFEDQLGLRTGYAGFQTLQGQFTAGISYRSRDWGLDYGYIGHPQYLGSSHRISASWRFGDSFLGKVKSFIPENVAAYVEGGIVTIKWTSSPSLALEGYNVYFSKTSGGGYQKINSKIYKANYAQFNGLEKNSRYYFVVTSVTNTIPPVESQYSREVIATTTSAPMAPNVTTSDIGNEGVVDIGKRELVEFGDPGKNGLKGYNIYFSEVSGGRFDKYNPQPVGNVPTYLIRKLKVGQRYYFRFTSVGLDGSESPPTAEVPVIALPYSAVVGNGAAAPNGRTK
jgi:hypothetical protein